MDRPLLILILILLLTAPSFAGVDIPRGLDTRARKQSLEILGLGTSTKFLSEPYPLGGYSGVEVGVSIESIGTEDLSSLGNTVESEEDFVYPKFSVGKGLYNDVDLYFNFVPYNESTEIRHFGGLMKWSFYQATFLPASFSLLIHGSTSNIGNLLNVQTGGASLITGITMTYLSIYFGGGRVYSTGRFDPTLTESGNEELTTLNAAHFIAGAGINIEPIFFSIELNQYTVPVISAKLGTRF